MKTFPNNVQLQHERRLGYDKKMRLFDGLGESPQPASESARIAIMIMTIFSVASVVMRHHFLIRWRLEQYKIALLECMIGTQDENRQKKLKKLSRSTVLKSPQFYTDLLILIIQPIPYFDGVVNMECINIKDHAEFVNVPFQINSILLSLMCGRLVLITRALLNYSVYTDKHAKQLWYGNLLSLINLIQWRRVWVYAEHSVCLQMLHYLKAREDNLDHPHYLDNSFGL
ncbi:hypothetical protein FGO68_gene15084 [Halteria grandinella]|uniref:Uncharacterized protein n=1 Tax=Halteria grandinella TaxID=5974 RepID=A0A8J8T846_HALGN|nr:hypothetical protein FGO68_gene15084 [Halteria grandinella]